MLVPENERPIYDERVKEILKGLAEGKTREQLAKELGYKNMKSMDVVIRRKNFVWDSREQNYVPKIKKGVNKEVTLVDSSKAGQVVSLLSKEGADLRTIAQRLGFKDHMELAKYMTSRGYEWDSEQGNYVKKFGKVQSETEKDEPVKIEQESNTSPNLKEELVGKGGLERFLPLLELLEKHKDKLLDLVIPGSEKGKIPRYIVPGVAKTKTVQMMNTLDQLVVDFSREKNISQREIFEVALIEFFRKYGYEYEIESLLGEM